MVKLNAQRIIKNSHISILSWVALGFAILTFCGRFMLFYGSQIHFHCPPVSRIILFIVNVSPFLLLVLYLKKFQNELKGTIIVPIIFALITLIKIYGLMSVMRLVNTIYRFNVIYRHYYFNRGALPYIVDIVFILFCVLSTISALKGLNKKIFVIISMGIGVVSRLIMLIGAFSHMEDLLLHFDNIVIISTFTEIISVILFYVALGFFSIKYRIPVILGGTFEKEKKFDGENSPEQSLKLLKDELELGMITEEEYQAQRAEIISKL